LQSYFAPRFREENYEDRLGDVAAGFNKAAGAFGALGQLLGEKKDKGA
jgi:hypothetical protein